MDRQRTAPRRAAPHRDVLGTPGLRARQTIPPAGDHARGRMVLQDPLHRGDTAPAWAGAPGTSPVPVERSDTGVARSVLWGGGDGALTLSRPAGRSGGSTGRRFDSFVRREPGGLYQWTG